MANLYAGAAVSDITPPLSTYLAGYYHARQAKDVHDALMARALYLSDGNNELAIVSCDLIGLPQDEVKQIKERVQALCGLKSEQVLIGATHTHTGPETREGKMFPVNESYLQTMAEKIADAVTIARLRAQPAALAWGLGQESTLSFNRRFWMKHGPVRTNPGIGNPEIVRPAGPIDPEMAVIAVQNAAGEPLAIWVNFALHLDTTGGDSISADYPNYLTEALQKRFGRDVVVLFNPAAMGDINHIDVKAIGQAIKGESHPSRIGNTLAGETIKVLASMNYSAEQKLAYAAVPVALPLRTVTPEQVVAAEQVIKDSNIGKQDFTMEIVAAHRDKSLAGKPDTLQTMIQALVIGDIALIGLPGEFFVELGMAVKAGSPFARTFIVELANDSIGYIPTRQAYEEGGYEPTSTILAPGTGELLVAESLKLLRSLYDNR